MFKIGFVFILLLEFHLFAKSCFSILTTVDKTIPTTPINQNFHPSFDKCQNNKTVFFTTKKAYYGCYNTKEKAIKVLQKNPLKLKNPKILIHPIHSKIPYLIKPKKANLSFKELQHTLSKIDKYTIDILSQKTPTHFYGNGIEILDIKQIDFIPFANLYTYYKKLKKKSHQKILVLYDGIYTLEMIYKKLHNKKYISKKTKNIYEIKIPIIITSTAKLVIKNKILHLQSNKKSIFIFYYGELYLLHNKIYAWDIKHNHSFRQKLNTKQKKLYFNYKNQSAYIIGLSGSKNYFLDNVFKGIGFYNPFTASGLGLLYFPNETKYFPSSKAFDYFLSKNNYPTGYYIGNDITQSIIAFQTNHAKDVFFLGNYTYDNLLHNFISKNNSKNIIIANNLITNTKTSHNLFITQETTNSTIANNIILQSASSGIMLQNTTNSTIYNNISLSNNTTGVALKKSENILIKKNLFFFNLTDGLYSKNSYQISIENNIIKYNANNGIQLTSDNNVPSSSILTNNLITKNINNAITIKNSVAVFLKENQLDTIKSYGGVLNYFSEQIKENKGFLLYGKALFPKQIRKKETHFKPTIFTVAKTIYTDLNKQQTTFAQKDLGILYLHINDINNAKEQFQLASSTLTKGALKYLGYLYLTDARLHHYKNKKKILQGLCFILEDLILQNPNISNLNKLIYFIPNAKKNLQNAFLIVKKRMKKGNIFAQEEKNKSPLCNTIQKQREIKRALAIFLYKMNLSHTNTINNYLHLLYKNYTVFTPENTYNFEQKITQYNQLQKQISQNKNISQQLLCQKQYQKKQYYKQQTDTIIQEFAYKKLPEITPKIRQHLKKINFFRKRKISSKKILKILQKGNKNAN